MSGDAESGTFQFHPACGKSSRTDAVYLTACANRPKKKTSKYNVVNLLSQMNSPEKLGFWRAELKRKSLHWSFGRVECLLTFGKRASARIYFETKMKMARI